MHSPQFPNAHIEAAWQLWHQYLDTHQASILEELLAEEVVFHSPVVWTPQQGKAITTLYLLGAAQVLAKDFHYTRKIVEGLHWALEFSCRVGEITVKGFYQ